MARRYWVYVIEVVKETPLFYVGQTGLNPRTRLHQHRCGARYCANCRYRKYVPPGYPLRLRLDLVPRMMPILRTRSQAEEAERRVARLLKWQGKHVIGGH